jgi:uncharacterized protein (TIGR00266 family)
MVKKTRQTTKVTKVTKVTKGGDSISIKANIVGSAGSNYLVLDIQSGEVIHTTPGSLIYMRGDIEKGELEVGGIGKAFARALGGQNLLLTKYKGGPNGGKVALGSALPGDIIAIEIAPKQDIIVSRGSFLCCTSNLEVTATTRMQGIFGFGQEEGFVLPVIRANETGGRVWLCSYGTFERIDLKTNEVVVLDNGTFLACPANLNYQVVRLGKTMLSSLAGGEGLGMQFTGPAALYLQSKNINDFYAIIRNNTETTSGLAKAGVGATIFEGLMNFGSKGGSSPKRSVRKK